MFHQLSSLPVIWSWNLTWWESTIQKLKIYKRIQINVPTSIIFPRVVWGATRTYSSMPLCHLGREPPPEWPAWGGQMSHVQIGLLTLFSLLVHYWYNLQKPIFPSSLAFFPFDQVYGGKCQTPKCMLSKTHEERDRSVGYIDCNQRRKAMLPDRTDLQWDARLLLRRKKRKVEGKVNEILEKERAHRSRKNDAKVGLNIHRKNGKSYPGSIAHSGERHWVFLAVLKCSLLSAHRPLQNVGVFSR